jgi:hypothetical protein
VARSQPEAPIPTTLETNAGFDLDLKGMLPRSHAHALSLARNSERAGDLVPQTSLTAPAGRESFRSDTLSPPLQQESGLILPGRAALARMLDPPAALPATLAHSHHD